MTDPIAEAYKGVLLDVCDAANFRSSVIPGESPAVNVAIAFESGISLALHHPEYARALATQFNAPETQAFMAECIVRGNPIGEPVEVEEAST